MRNLTRFVIAANVTAMLVPHAAHAESRLSQHFGGTGENGSFVTATQSSGGDSGERKSADLAHDVVQSAAEPSVLLSQQKEIDIPVHACTLTPITVELQFDGERVTASLPTTGSVVEEAHYVTTLDKLPDGASYPRPMAVQPKDASDVQCNEGIEDHLLRSLEIYRGFQPDVTMDDLYSKWWHKVWTPQESAQCGQGSIGDEQLETLTPQEEMWLYTMNWAPGNRPPPGTRFLLSWNGRHVVAVAGYETGPEVPFFLGGASPEVHHWLGTDNHTTEISVGLLTDQSLEPGPIQCSAFTAEQR